MVVIQGWDWLDIIDGITLDPLANNNLFRITNHILIC